MQYVNKYTPFCFFFYFSTCFFINNFLFQSLLTFFEMWVVKNIYTAQFIAIGVSSYIYLYFILLITQEL